MNEQKPTEQKLPSQAQSFRDAAWVLGVGSQAGLMLAVPVLAGLAVGYLLDRALNTLPWITLFFTLVGIVVGPVIVYRMVTQAVQAHLDQKRQEEE